MNSSNQGSIDQAPRYLVFLDYLDDPVYANNTEQTLYWEEPLSGVKQKFVGLGGISSIDGLSQNTDLSSSTVSLSLGIYNADQLSSIKKENYWGRKVYIWEARINDIYQVISAKQAWKGVMSNHTVEISAESAGITMQCVDLNVAQHRSANLLVNHQQQQEYHPNDNLFRYATSLRNTSIEI